jgi:polysaccharide deacetylase 2 family uncharacterized protein YibQ
MAQNAAPFSAIGRTVFIKSFAKTNATQAELNELVKAVQLTSTITAIGAFVPGTSDVVNMIIEGADVGDLAGFTTSDVAF